LRAAPSWEIVRTVVEEGSMLGRLAGAIVGGAAAIALATPAAASVVRQLPIGVRVLFVWAAPSAQDTQRWALINASSIGFSEQDCSACVQGVPGTDPVTQRKTPITIDALFANALAGNAIAQGIVRGVFTRGVRVPYVPLNEDPCDAFHSYGGTACTSDPDAPGFMPFAATSRTLNETLTDQQEALLGCGPLWGTDCEVDGIDLTGVEASVLMQSFPGIDPPPPGARGPGDPGYDPNIDGCVAPDDPLCAAASPLAVAGVPFRSEMAALSWNFLMTLVAFSQPDPGADPTAAEFDPNAPTSSAEGQCSFAQPQNCSAVISFLAPEPETALAGAIACLSLALFARMRRSI
jgi:hypothetical protein